MPPDPEHDRGRHSAAHAAALAEASAASAALLARLPGCLTSSRRSVAASQRHLADLTARLARRERQEARV